MISNLITRAFLKVEEEGTKEGQRHTLRKGPLALAWRKEVTSQRIQRPLEGEASLVTTSKRRETTSLQLQRHEFCQQPERSGNKFSPGASRREHSADTLILVQGDPYQIPVQRTRRWEIWGFFKILNSQEFVMAAIEKLKHSTMYS